MPTYIVTVREVWNQRVKVEATNEKEAIALVEDGAGTYLENALEYNHTMEKGTWTIEKE